MKVFSIRDSAGRDWSVEERTVAAALAAGRRLGAQGEVVAEELPRVIELSLGEVCDALLSSLADLGIEGDAREPAKLVWRRERRGYELLRQRRGMWFRSLPYAIPARMAPR